ncbi:MAG TPA: GNAT family N-acetyltransferase [Polyangia bacterium]
MLLADVETLPRIAGPRIELRAITADDTEAIYRLFSDRQVMRFLTSPPLEDRAAARRLIAELDELRRLRLAFHWGVARRDSTDLIGTCTLHNVRAGHLRAEVGFALRPGEWGCGLGSEVLTALCRYAFEELELHRLEADADPNNARCIRLLERHGFACEGVMRERWHQDGEGRDALFFGLLRRDFRATATPGLEALQAEG